MPLILTTPYNPGDLDSVEYAEARIQRIDIVPGSNQIQLYVEHGNTVDGTWVAGLDQAHKHHLVRDVGGDTDYTTMLSVVPNGTENLYEAIKRVAYQWLLDKGHFAGTVA